MNELIDNTNDELVNIMKEKLTEEELKMYMTNFYLYLNYDCEKDFIIDFSSILDWIGYSRKDNAKKVLVDKFEENKNYIIQKADLQKRRESFAPELSGAKIGIRSQGGSSEDKGAAPSKIPEVCGAKTSTDSRGGSNKETILLTIDCFKEFCMEINSKKAKEVRKYYIKLEKIQNEYNKIRLKVKVESEIAVAIAQEKERHVLEKSKDVSGIYWLINHEEKLCKFGSSNNIYKRVIRHKNSDFKNFVLDNITKTVKYLDLENEIRPYANENYSGHTEIIKFSEISEINDIYKIIKRKNNLLSYNDSNNYELEKEKLKLEQKKEDNENLRLQIELRKLELSQRQNTDSPQACVSQTPPIQHHDTCSINSNMQPETPGIVDIAKKMISGLSDEEKARFTDFLEKNVVLHRAETNQSPMRIQEILDTYLVRPRVSSFVKNRYTKIVEAFITKNYPRETPHTGKRKVNGVSTRGWYNFKLTTNGNRVSL